VRGQQNRSGGWGNVAPEPREATSGIQHEERVPRDSETLNQLELAWSTPLAPPAQCLTTGAVEYNDLLIGGSDCQFAIPEECRRKGTTGTDGERFERNDRCPLNGLCGKREGGEACARNEKVTRRLGSGSR
jgi:hypothetical protein